MDRVRFGRVLGKGARLAARTAMEAVDAATASAPAPPPAVRHRPTPSQRSQQGPEHPLAATPSGQRGGLRLPAISLPTGLLPAARAAQTGFVSPLKQASRALWYELTGSFFALFALSFAMGAWRTRAALWSVVPGERNRAAAFCALAFLFLYFSVSSFLRARRRKAA